MNKVIRLAQAALVFTGCNVMGWVVGCNPSMAQTPTPTPATCTGAYINSGGTHTLTGNYTDPGGLASCFFVDNGTLFNADGYSITCAPTDGNTHCGAAVTVIDDENYSTVRNAHISGPFATGIEGGERINGNVIQLTAGAIYPVGIHWKPRNGFSLTVLRVYDNYVSVPDPGAAIQVESSFTGGSAPDIENNFLFSPDLVLLGNVTPPTGKFDLLKNVMAGGGTTYGLGSSLNTRSGNACAPDTNVCEALVVPFVMP